MQISRDDGLSRKIPLKIRTMYVNVQGVITFSERDSDLIHWCYMKLTNHRTCGVVQHVLKMN